MESKLARILKCRFSPVALTRTDSRPENALSFRPGRRACIMSLFVNAAKGRTCVADAAACGCPGAVTGMGFGDGYRNFPGGTEALFHFLSRGCGHTEAGRRMGEAMRKKSLAFADDFLCGERYKKTPEAVRQWHDAMPVLKKQARCVVFRPLGDIGPGGEKPDVVVFIADATQLSALAYMADYEEAGGRVIMPWGSGCQQIGLLAFHEAESSSPRAVVGLTDPSARVKVKRAFGSGMLTFAVPWQLFLWMEDNVEGSFLFRPTFSRMMD